MAEMYDQNQEERRRFDEKPMGSSAEKEKKENPYRNYSKPRREEKPSQPVSTPSVVFGNVLVSASIEQISPSKVVPDGYEFSNSNIIPSEIISGSYAPSDPSSSIELFIYDYNKEVISANYNYGDWKITQNTEVPNVPTTYINDEGIEVIQDEPIELTTDIIEVNPAGDAYDMGIDSGQIYVLYNFLTNELASTNENPYYIAEISGDRTEVRLKSNTIQNADTRRAYLSLKQKLNSSEYFDEFYLNFYNNVYSVGINVILDNDETQENVSVLVKTFEAIPNSVQVNDQVYVVTKPSETIAYQVEFNEDFSELIEEANYIKGPNINISLQELVNNSTTLKSYNDLTNTSSSSSLDSVLNVLNQKGVTITPNYSYNTFNEFVNFSSAKARVNNFYEKVSQIQSYQADIDTISATTGSNPTVGQISQSLASLQTNITNLVENFDGYETYLYQNSSSFAYPKTGSSYPYTLLPTGSTEVLEWMGSDVENSQYYGGIILSASVFDENNQNWLYYTIPDFITENTDNDNYITFTNMVGQSFDEIWLYTKALSERYNTINDPDKGLPLDLAADAIKNLGFETFGNNYDNQDNFIGLTGEDNGVYVPPTGSELITQYIAINNGQIVNYWDIGYSWLNYVQQINEPGFPYAIDKVSKEIYKRLYHNMAYLTKKKGTISGLRQLINIWGIPNTILRINEFGGKNRDNTDDYDLWYNRYSYAYTPVANTFAASSSVRVPWMPLQRNLIADSQYIVPDGVALRFKTFGHPSSSFGGSYYSQSIAVKKSNGTTDDEFDWGIGLFYEDQPSGSYSGSSFSDYYDYGKLRFYMSSSTGAQVSNDIYLPFFDGGWWTVLLQRDQHVSASDHTQGTTYTLYAGNKLDNGWDGNNIGWTGSVSMSSLPVVSFEGYDGGFYEEAIYDYTSTVNDTINEAWNKFGVTSNDGVYVGGYISGSKVGVEVLNEGAKIFSGSLQEFRYYSNNIAQTVFNDFVMNPESVEGNNVTGSESSFDIVNFRAPLGNELEHTFTSSYSSSYSENISSSHPAVTGSAPSVITSSFIDPTTSAVTSSYEFIHFSASTTRTFSKTNVETYFLDQPSIGVRNRVSNKIQIDDGEVYGNVLSKYRSIQQNYLISESYTEDTTGLEVGFSPQDEVNDDIIATYGYGVISDTLADPRFAFSGSQTYYPQLRRTAEDYFKKYTEGNVWDYLRLIKYFDNSIFKAIKSYVPARTSVTTGVIIKQHMLERNRRVPVTVDPNTVIAYTPETGSVVGGQSTITGNNSPISFRNLEITGSINFLSVTGSTGGTLNRYNGEVTQSFYMTGSLGTGINPLVAIEPEYQKVFDDNIGAVRRHLSGSWTFNRTLDTIDFTAPFKGRFSFYSLEGDVFGSFIIPDPQLRFLFSSSIRGNVYEQVVTSESLSQLENIYTDFIKFTPEEKFTLWVRGEDQSGTPTSIGDAGRISMSLLDVDFYGLGDGIKPYSSSIHNSYVTQSWIVKNATISGSAYEIHDYQDEFFNGEFSGSEFIATTQSLLYNPYAPSQTLNTSYKIAISTSLGQWTSGVGTSEAISTYPSYSIEMDVKAFPIGGPGEDELNEMIEDFTGAALDYNKGFIILYQDKTDPSQFFIYAIGFPAISAPIGDPTPSSTSRTVLGFNGSNNWIGGISDIPLPPVSASGFDGGLYTGSNDTPAYQYNNIGPYFKLDISGSILPTATTTAFTSLEFVTDSLAGGLSSSIVISPLLGNSTNIQKYATQYATGAGGTQMLVYKFPQAINASTKKIYRPIRFNGTPDRGGLPDMSNVFVTGSGGVPTYVTMSVYYSNFDLAYNGVEGPFGKSWLTNASDPGFEAASPGSGSMLLQGLTWTGSFGDSGYYAPYGLVFTKYSVDEFGNLINNSETIVQNPNFDFDTTNYQGVTASIDDYGLRGGQFRQNLAVVDSILSFPRGEDILTGLGYKYDPINSRPLSGSPYKASGLPVQYLPTRSQDLQFINFNPQLPAFIDFYNTPYNSLINNVTQSVPNTYLQVVEYEGGSSTGSSGVPSNIIPITNNTAEKARIPDSFYTQKASITPRYFGSKLQSANYNSFTPSGSSIVNLNAFLLSSSNSQSFTGYRTGSIWGGDALPGTMRSTNTPLSTVFKAPIYFAHYKSSKNNQDLQGTYTFDIDALIQVPLEDITGDKAPELPVIIKVDGSNENLTNVRSTFEVDRKALVSYNTAQQFISGSGKTIKYDTLPVGSNRIYQGGMEYQYIGTNKLLGGYLINNTNLTTSFQPYGTYASTQSFFTSSLFEGFVTTRFGVGGNASDIFTDGSYSSYLSQGSSPNSGSLNYSGSGREYWMSTSSLGGFNENEGVLFLEGGPATISASLGSFGRNTYTGPSLALFHTANIWVSNSIIASNNTTNPGIPDNVTIDPTDPSYYFRFNFVSSSMQSYDDFELPFIIKQGDEISVTYNVGPEQAPTIVTQDFNVIEVRSRATRTGTITSDQIVYGNPVLPGTLNKVSKNRIYDQLVVYPDPTTIPNPIPNGHIWNFAIRRRVNADDRVIIFQTPPRNAEGAATPSPSGYLIPADMTPIQKRNVQSLITQLNAKNAFPSDQADNEPIRGEGF